MYSGTLNQCLLMRAATGGAATGGAPQLTSMLWPMRRGRAGWRAVRAAKGGSVCSSERTAVYGMYAVAWYYARHRQAVEGSGSVCSMASRWLQARARKAKI